MSHDQEYETDKESYNEGDIDSQERGTCARTNAGKLQFSLFPVHLTYGAVKVLMWGARKYAAWNWAKGGPWSTAFDCMVRHLLKWWYCGEECDRESGLHHLDHALCNLMFLIHYKDTYTDGDDRPPSSVTMFDTAIAHVEERFELPEKQSAHKPCAKGEIT